MQSSGYGRWAAVKAEEEPIGESLQTVAGTNQRLQRGHPHAGRCSSIEQFLLRVGSCHQRGRLTAGGGEGKSSIRVGEQGVRRAGEVARDGRYGEGERALQVALQ